MRPLHRIPPAAGAIVMGTGIVSVALVHDHRQTLSRVLLAITAAVWLTLGVSVLARLSGNAARVRREAATPVALTGVAGTAVLGTRLALLGWSWAAAALLAAALMLWLVLLAPVLSHHSTPTVGASLLLTVSTESLAALSASLGAHLHAAWLLYIALVLLALGLGFYVLVISRFDLRQLAVGRGDQWIAGGALAISTLAAGRLSLAAGKLHQLGGGSWLEGVALALWGLTIAWLPVLLVAEVARPRLSYDLGRWATVFPVGMYAACSFIVGADARIPGITAFARVWVWVALVVWLAAAFGAFRAFSATRR